MSGAWSASAIRSGLSVEIATRGALEQAGHYLKANYLVLFIGDDGFEVARCLVMNDADLYTLMETAPPARVDFTTASDDDRARLEHLVRRASGSSVH